MRAAAVAGVCIRVRGIFEDARLSRGQARGKLVYGYIAVAGAADRKPILFASLDDKTGHARVFVSAARCSEDS
jgi:hypothetical protein